jgi:hypothetical protein
MVKVVASPDGLPQWPEDSIGGDRFLTEVAKYATKKELRRRQGKPKQDLPTPSPQEIEGGEELPQVELF